MVSEMPFSEVKGISLLDLLLRHLSQNTVYVSQRTVTCFFPPFHTFTGQKILQPPRMIEIIQLSALKGLFLALLNQERL